MLFYTELPFCFTSLLSDLRKSGRYDDLLALFRHNGMHVRVRVGEHAPTRATRPAGLLLPPAERGHSAKLRGRALARAARPREQVGMDIAPPRKIALQLADERRLPRKIRKGNHVTP